ncbi:hypothetical protein IRZ71_24300 [Flavobacterium sp. ANB]|uniref:hypothetical protein n=1 Tax=unclassified Flavobacterium TaxID=196869 RepID=UPI0012B8C793|nr:MULTISPECIES: hypothetical protein [unclassified Flavobacterium]MBF4519478.1 hypothetical protein [Flavobacterium sp. ANB]MTD72511.1 hypothetical protein [Flavobacterium sp. LC2016-13]
MVDQTTQEEKQYRFELTEFKLKNPSADEKFFINYRIKVLEKVLEEYYETADFYEGEELDGKEFINGVWTVTKTGTASDYLVFTIELDFLKDKLIELSKPKQIETVGKENPFPSVFANSNVYDKFIEYAQKHIIEAYTDYSYLKKRMQHENLIHDIKDNSFMKVIFEDMKLINKKDYDYYLVERKLKSLKKSSNDQRENNFNIIFGGLI